MGDQVASFRFEDADGAGLQAGKEGAPSKVAPAGSASPVAAANAPRVDSEAGRAQSPEVRAGLLSKIVLYWVGRIFPVSKAKRRAGGELEAEDLWALSRVDQAAELSARFDAVWSAHGKLAPSARLSKALWRQARGKMAKAAVLKLIICAETLSLPLVIREVLNSIFAAYNGFPAYYSVGGLAVPVGYCWSLVFAVALLMATLVNQQYNLLTQRAFWQARSVLTNAVYRKALRLSAASRNGTTQGEIVNLMQLDSERIAVFFLFFNEVWAAAVLLVGLVAQLYLYVGAATFVSFGVMVGSIPLVGGVLFVLRSVQIALTKAQDKRSKLMNEVLQGIQWVKMAALEFRYDEMVTKLRSDELRLLRKRQIALALGFGFALTIPTLAAVATLAVYATQNPDPANFAATLFTALAALNLLRAPLLILPSSLSSVIQAAVSRTRMARFLALDEVEESGDTAGQQQQQPQQPGPAILIENGEFYWGNPNAPKPSLGSKSKSDKSDKGKAGKAGKSGKSGKSSKEDKRASKGKTADSKVAGDLENPAALEPASAAAAAAAEEEDDKPAGPALSGVSLSVARGALVGIAGPVGSGKSSLVSALLGEMFTSKGSVSVRGGSMAYAAQTAWILNMSVRDNILFGAPYEEKRYKEVLRACQLMADLALLPDGDETIIGERGINLSGGQKQRIAIARAAFSKLPVVLLDDPLSALDPEVAARVFEQCICGLLRGRTRVLVTNQLQFLPKCDQVIVLQRGRVAEQGTYRALLRADRDFAKLVQEFSKADATAAAAADAAAAAAETEAAQGAQDEAGRRSSLARLAASRLSLSNGAGQALEEALLQASGAEPEAPVAEGDADAQQKQQPPRKAAQQLMQDEERQKGAVPFKTYKNYVMAGGGLFMVVVVMLAALASEGSNTGNRAWVTFWSGDPYYNNHSLSFYLIGYGITGLLITVTMVLNILAVMTLGLKASQKLHDGLLKSILRAPMSFFETTPTGRILARFSKDMSLVDDQLSAAISQAVTFFVSVLFGLGAIAYATPLFLLLLPVLAPIYMLVLFFFQPVNRDAKRLESLSRSPIYAHFSETLSGLPTIRAYAAQDAFRAKAVVNVDDNTRATYLLRTLGCWLGFRLDLIGNTISIAACVLAVHASLNRTISSDLAGFSLSYSTAISTLLQAFVTSFAFLETAMVSSERIEYYSKHVEQEEADVLQPGKSNNKSSGSSATKPLRKLANAPANWPSAGAIEISGLSMRYRKDTPLVLRGVSLSIRAGARVGVVGRTGSGKSSLLLSLLRIVEPERDAQGRGPIKIDGVDTTSIALKTLRSAISVLPQNPVIFSGTVRSNLDPFGLFSDEQINEALRKVELAGKVSVKSDVAEYGENLSQGERQLLIMAKATLSKSRIVLFDEASSSLDSATDALVQRMIRESFTDSTLICIAHRLSTIIDSDKILVMDKGLAVEFASPATLLADPASKFSGMLHELGPDMAAGLREAANRAALKRKSSAR